MRTTGIKPSLTLEKVRGIRIDTGPVSYVPLKKENKFPEPVKSIKYSENITKDGYKY